MPSHGGIANRVLFDGGFQLFYGGARTDVDDEISLEVVTVEVRSQNEKERDFIGSLAVVPCCHDVGRFLNVVWIIDVNGHPLDVKRIVPSFAVLPSANNIPTVGIEQRLSDSDAFLFRKATIMIPNQAWKREPTERRNERITSLKNDGKVVFPILLGQRFHDVCLEASTEPESIARRIRT